MSGVLRLSLLGLLFVLLGHSPALAAEDGGTLQAGWMAVGLVGGLALFLYGMDHLASALKTLAGARLRFILSKMTRNRFMAAVSGALITGLVQSSSVTTVLVVGFVSAGLMPFAQSIAVIMGANVGSTLTAQIIAFKVEAIAPLFIAIGFGMMMMGGRKRFALAGKAILGMGMLFFGMGMMSEAMEPLRTYPPFIDLMAQMRNPVLAIIVAAAFTALVQSSAATTGIVIVLAGQGLVSLDGGIALIFGANIGTCFTALLVTIGKGRDALRTAIGHVLFNIGGVLLWLPFIPQFAEFVSDITNVSNGGGADIAREIANAHSIFNIANVILMIGFVPWIARLIEKIVPLETVIDPPLDPSPKYLMHEVTNTPAAAIALLRNEVIHMGDIVTDVVRRGQEAMRNPTTKKLTKISELDDGVDDLQDAIALFAGKIRRSDLLPKEHHRLQNDLAVSNHLEAASDLVAEEMVGLVSELMELRQISSEESRAQMAELFVMAEDCLKQALTAYSAEDREAALAVLSRKEEFNEKLDLTLRRISDAIGPRDVDIRSYRITVALVERMNRLFERARRIAHVTIANLDEREAAGSEETIPPAEMPSPQS
ncbi:Na/Pi cotransporter family protein [Thalassospira profundimaris]|uniref:Na/Pi cotransporter family protein n=1 Tax=Thalassospira profundimaris TaxID=502049 RepID=UPI000DEDF8D6|nr:Na/Pi cotransporter family protein [Thalassospira profundimaris]